MLGFLPTRAYRPGTPGTTTFLSPLSGTFNYGWDSFGLCVDEGLVPLDPVEDSLQPHPVGGRGVDEIFRRDPIVSQTPQDASPSPPPRLTSLPRPLILPTPLESPTDSGGGGGGGGGGGPDDRRAQTKSPCRPLEDLPAGPGGERGVQPAPDGAAGGMAERCMRARHRGSCSLGRPQRGSEDSVIQPLTVRYSPHPLPNADGMIVGTNSSAIC